MKKWGPNPISNTALAAVLEKAKELDVPKEILDRNIKRASEKGQEAYIEKIYEVGIYIIYHFYLRDARMFNCLELVCQGLTLPIILLHIDTSG